MAEYHFYFLNSQFRIQSRKIAQCIGDVEALEFAQAMKSGYDVEIWRGAVMVTRLNAIGDSAPKSLGAEVRTV